MINLNYLRYFYICAQSGTFTKAAERLRISQPSLSIQIKTFEEQLGFQLFIRSGRTIQLTTKGQGLFLYAAQIFDVTDHMEKYLKKNVQSEGHRLNIGVSDEVERPFIADVVGKLIKTNSVKNLIPSILSKKHAEVVNLLSNDEIDLMITNEKNSELKLVYTTSIPVLLISANPIAMQKSQQSLNGLMKMIGQDLILPVDDMILAAQTKNFLKKKNIQFEAALTSNILACITRAVQENLGAAFLPAAYVQRELKSSTLFAYGPKEGFWKHNIYLYTNKKNTNAFISSLSRILQDFSALKFNSQLYEMKL
jgi:LysR family transcriptional regulator, transcriptional activator of nhaA